MVFTDFPEDGTLFRASHPKGLHAGKVQEASRASVLLRNFQTRSPTNR